MQLSYTLQMAVVIVTALGGMGFGVSLLLLWFSLGGEQQFVTTSIFYTAISGVVTLIGLIVLKLSKSPENENPNQE
jgi:uncharacterized membrane protein YfcA